MNELLLKICYKNVSKLLYNYDFCKMIGLNIKVCKVLDGIEIDLKVNVIII